MTIGGFAMENNDRPTENNDRPASGRLLPFGSRQEPASLASGCHHGINLQKGLDQT